MNEIAWFQKKFQILWNHCAPCTASTTNNAQRRCYYRTINLAVMVASLSPSTHIKLTRIDFSAAPFLQGISYWNVFYDLTLTDKNMQARICLKVVLKSWDLDIWVSSTSFQKNNISWPQQPPTEKVLKFNMIFHDSTNFFSKHQNKAEFKNLNDCWGQPILLFFKLVDETKISKPQDFRTTFKQILACIFVSVSQFINYDSIWDTLYSGVAPTKSFWV